MRLSFLGGAGEVGRSAILLESDVKLLMDYGIKIEKPAEFPLRLPGPVNAFILSHAHLDHSGAAPWVYDTCEAPCIATYPTHALSQMLLIDSLKIMKHLPYSHGAYKKFVRNFMPAIYGRPMHFGRSTVTLHDAGHVPGAAITEINSGGKKIIYTADFKDEDSFLHHGAKAVEGADALIIESTYSNREHPNRAELVEKLHTEVEFVLENGGNVIMPAFAVGRSQELAIMLRELDRRMPVFLDGMAKGASEIVLNYPAYVKDAHALQEALGSLQWVESPRERAKALAQPSVIVTTAGMLEGGPALDYIGRLNRSEKAKKSRIIFTGYCIDGTNGWLVQNKGMIRLDHREVRLEIPHSYYDFSAHAGRSGLLKFIEESGPEKVFCVHGEHCGEFAKELGERGFDAHAPRIGEKVSIE